MPVKELNAAPVTTAFRASYSAYVVISLILAFPLLASLVGFIEDRKFWQPLAICVVILSFFIVWLSCFRIEISEEALSYRSLFSRKRTLSLSNVGRAEVCVGYNNYSDRFRPPLRLVVQPRAGINERPIIINIKVFHRKNIDFLVSVLSKPA